jgi:hypothetical protein
MKEGKNHRDATIPEAVPLIQLAARANPKRQCVSSDATAAATTLIGRLSRAVREMPRIYAAPALIPVTRPADETIATPGSLLSNPTLGTQYPSPDLAVTGDAVT